MSTLPKQFLLGRPLRTAQMSATLLGRRVRRSRRGRDHSAVPPLSPHAVALRVGFTSLLALMNLRGVKESGRVFALPTSAARAGRQGERKNRSMARGTLRVYLGAPPGVGKTYAMLSEAHRRVERGTDVVVGYVEPHGRPRTEALLHGLEQVPRREIEYRGALLTEMDVDAVLARLRAAVRRAAPAGPTTPFPSSRPTRSPSTSPPRRSTGMVRTYGSPPPNGTCWRYWSATPGGWSARSSCCRRSGPPRTAPRATICGST